MNSTIPPALGYTECWPKKKVAKSGHPKMAKSFGQLAKKKHFLGPRLKKKKGQLILLASNLFPMALYLLRMT